MNPSATHGAFSWPELMTTDPEAAASFYGKLVGWAHQVMPMPQGDYHLQLIGKQPVAGIMNLPEPGIPTVWVHYITVDDVDAIAAKAAKLGGKVEVPPMDIPSVGRFCGLSDPQGAFFHVIKYVYDETEMPEVDYTQSFATHGAFSWWHLVTSDPDAATEFYSRLLGWEIEDMEMPSGPYRMFKVGDAGMGGIMKAWEEGMPPHWGAYVTVDDADGTAAAASSAGGTILVPPTDIEEVGRFTTIQDPTGAVLNFITYVPMG